MKKRSIRVMTIAGLCSFASLALGSCQSTCSGDPRFDNYWCARGNLASGTYARQTAQLRQTAADRQLEAATLRSRLAERQAALSAARTNRTSNAEVQRLENDVTSLRRQIAALNR